MNVTLKDIKKKIHEMKYEDELVRSAKWFLANGTESDNGFSIVAGSADKDQPVYAVFAGYVPSLDLCCLTGWISEEYPVDRDEIPDLVRSIGFGRIYDQAIITAHHDGENDTLIIIPYDEELLENFIDSLTVMHLVCMHLIEE